MKFLINILLTALALLIADYLVPGVAINSFAVALLASLVLGIVNVLIKPVVLLLTLPINIVTLGLFTFVVNALMVLLVAAIVPGFTVTGFLPALIFSLIVSVFKIIFNRF